MTEQEKIQIPLTPFAKGGDYFLSIYFHPHWVLQSSIKVHPENPRA